MGPGKERVGGRFRFPARGPGRPPFRKAPAPSPIAGPAGCRGHRLSSSPAESPPTVAASCCRTHRRRLSLRHGRPDERSPLFSSLCRRRVCASACVACIDSSFSSPPKIPPRSARVARRWHTRNRQIAPDASKTGVLSEKDGVWKVYKTAALPTELRRQVLLRREATGFRDACSTRHAH